MWPFKRIITPKPGLQKLVFKSGEAFVDYHCKYMVTKLERGATLAGLVLDPEIGDAPIKVDDKGIQRAWLRIASDDGGFKVIAETLSKGAPLSPGDAVAWVADEFWPMLAKGADDERFGWMGVIVAKVAPEVDLTKPVMTVICSY